MSAETVTLKIEEKARESAEGIIAQAQKESEKRYSDLISEAKIREEKIIDTAEKNADTLCRGILQGAKQKAKLDELKVKRSLMLEVKSMALSKLLKSPEKTLIGIFEKAIKESGLSGEFTLIPSAIHKKILEKNLTTLEKAGDIKIKTADTHATLSSGFLLSSDIYDVDFSLEAILEELFVQNEKVIYNTLFESGEVK